MIFLGMGEGNSLIKGLFKGTRAVVYKNLMHYWIQSRFYDSLRAITFPGGEVNYGEVILLRSTHGGHLLIFFSLMFILIFEENRKKSKKSNF